jgi:hypothetical protein
MSRPTQIRAGDTYTYTVTSSDYPATDGWTLSVTLNNATTRKEVSAVANGADYDVTLASTDTDDFAAGVCQMVEAVEKGSGLTLERHTIFAGSVTILANLAGATVAADFRSHARKTLDAIEAAIEGRATRGQLASTVIGDRQVQYLAPEELIKWRSFYQSEVKREEAAERIAQGLDGGNRTLIRFATRG